MRYSTVTTEDVYTLGQDPDVLSGILDILGTHVEGTSRRVYFPEVKPLHKYVVKIATNGQGIDSNLYEYDIWINAKTDNWPVQRWLAPVVGSSDNAAVIIQAKIDPIRVEDIPKLPRRIPKWMTDLKPENWGWYKGRIVCCDYGNHLLLNGCVSKKTKKADWWSSESELSKAIDKWKKKRKA